MGGEWRENPISFTFASLIEGEQEKWARTKSNQICFSTSRLNGEQKGGKK